MTNGISLLPVSNLLGKNFFFPSYQRGYRWTEEQVKDLMNDIHSFARKPNKSDKEFYCLQPIVIKQCPKNIIEDNNLSSELDNNTWYEVIDGQQRLTTLRILLSYLVDELYPGSTLYQRHKKHLYNVEYQIKKELSSFLDDIKESNEFIDFHFISEAYSTIKKWFDSKQIEDPQQAKEEVRNTLIYSQEKKKQEGIVQVIWYELDENINPIDTIIRINMGKIPLTDSELIKALFLQKRNFKNQEIATRRQLEIANEWDQIESVLQNDDFWGFLSDRDPKSSARIELLFSFIFDIKNRKNSQNEASTEDENSINSPFRYFNSLFNDENSIKMVEKNWKEVKNYFHAFEEWFSDPIWYHYVGFLIYSGSSLIEIFELYEDTKKDKFTENLKNEIKSKLKDISCSKNKQIQNPANSEERNQHNDLKSKYTLNLQYNSSNDKKKIRKVLLLLNIQFIVKYHLKTNENGENEGYIKFPFKLFKNEKWDVEHIDSATANNLKDFKTQKEWVETAINDLKQNNPLNNHELINKIDDFINQKNNVAFEEIHNDLVNIVEEVPNDEEIKNNIGNLTLLNAKINRSYGNALFPTKRRVIIEKDKLGYFIPICTKNVFLKYFNVNTLTGLTWKRQDILNYQDFIVNILEEFLTIKEPLENE